MRRRASGSGRGDLGRTPCAFVEPLIRSHLKMDSAGWRYRQPDTSQPPTEQCSYSSQHAYAGPTPDCPPVFWPPTYNPLALLPRDDGDDQAAYEQPHGPASYGHGPISTRLRPMSPPGPLPPRPPLSADAAAAYRDAQAAVPVRAPSPAEASTSVEVPKRRLEFLREEGAKSAFDALKQRIQDDANACFQVRALRLAALSRPCWVASRRRILDQTYGSILWGRERFRRGLRELKACQNIFLGPQFVAENEDQQTQLKTLRKEIEELQGVLGQLASALPTPDSTHDITDSQPGRQPPVPCACRRR